MKVLKEAYKLLKLYGVVGHSPKTNLFGLHPLVLSLFFIFLTEWLANCVRRFVQRNFSAGLLRRLVLEFIATAELCGACFELIIVADNYGVWAYGALLFVLSVWWSLNWENESACPYIPMEDVLERNENIVKAALVIVAQVLGGLSIFQYIQVLWSFQLAETHKDRAFEECTADLQVHMVTGAVIEAAGTCICRVTSKVLGETHSGFSSVLDSLFSTSMVVAAFHYSGGYFNPALATSLKYGCQGNTNTEHLVVYWLGPIVGDIISIPLFRTAPIQNTVKILTRKHD